MQIEYPLWHIWEEKGTPLQELRWQWSYPDVLKALAVLEQSAAYDLAVEGLQDRPEKE